MRRPPQPLPNGKRLNSEAGTTSAPLTRIMDVHEGRPYWWHQMEGQFSEDFLAELIKPLNKDQRQWLRKSIAAYVAEMDSGRLYTPATKIVARMPATTELPEDLEEFLQKTSI